MLAFGPTTHSMVFLGYKTIRDGDRAAVWSNNGTVKVVSGPTRVLLFRQKLAGLAQYTATQAQYLEVRKRAGPVEIVHGPCSRFLDPVEDQSISVLPAIVIDASEALVVYRHNTESDAKEDVGSRVERRVVRGPSRFIPSAEEWIHEFSWSGVPKNGSKTSYQPKALQFTKLKTIPSSAYHNVNEVRTNDDTLITVKLMLFFELVDLERMLDASNDPIGDFINAASSDVVAFCATLSYETFLNETHKLNDLRTFSQLTQRAEQIGYKMSKVVFRGFQAGDKLQAMHDSAIQERTRLRLKEETIEQEQRAEDLRLNAEQRRAAKEAELAMEQARLKAEVSLTSQKASLAERALQAEAELERNRVKHEAEMVQARREAEAEAEAEARTIELEKARNEEQLRMMREMQALGVDLTQVLVSQHEIPGNVIRLETGDGAKTETSQGQAQAGRGLLGALQLNL